MPAFVNCPAYNKVLNSALPPVNDAKTAFYSQYRINAAALLHQAPALFTCSITTCWRAGASKPEVDLGARISVCIENETGRRAVTGALYLGGDKEPVQG